MDGQALVGNPSYTAGDESGGESGEDTGTGDESDDSDSNGGGSTGDIPEDPQPQPTEHACEVLSGLDAALPCDAQAPSTEFDPVIAWSWSGNDSENSVIVTPIVANFDDDNDDGEVDLCDRPELAVIAVDLPADKSDPLPPGHIYILDSVTGEPEQIFATPVDATTTPVAADLDGDGRPEILALQRGQDFGDQEDLRRVVAFQADGTIEWVADTWVSAEINGSLSIADLDADGSPEILAPNHVLSASGELLWEPLETPEGESIPVAVDLDLDGTLEVMFGRSAYDFAGNELFVIDLPGNKSAGIPAFANFDDDPYPELYIQSNQHRIYEHDGQLKGACGNGSKDLPVTIADINGDGQVEVLAQRGNFLRALEVNLAGEDFEGEFDNRELSCDELWKHKLGGSHDGAATTFDFLATGNAETIYADRDSVRLLSPDGDIVAKFDRQSRPSTSIPIVVDADNDGAAELLIVGSEAEGGDSELDARAAVMLIQNADDHFAPTRRIWNQHAYHATNIREDGDVPVSESLDWQLHNSFRSNPAPGYEGSSCQEADMSPVP